jgi:hypothetical protein
MEPPKKMKTVEERRSEIRKSLQARKESKVGHVQKRANPVGLAQLTPPPRL